MDSKYTNNTPRLRRDFFFGLLILYLLSLWHPAGSILANF